MAQGLSLICCLLLYGLLPKNGFIIFKWLHKILHNDLNFASGSTKSKYVFFWCLQKKFANLLSSGNEGKWDRF